MNFIISASTDIGQKQVNQDSLFVRRIQTGIGEIVFAVLCDGMGGIEKGEVASAELISAFTDWMYTDLPHLLYRTPEDGAVREQWSDVIGEQNRRMREYCLRESCSMGTTVTGLLLTPQRYYIMNIGDSRTYELLGGIRQITEDHTVIAQEVSRGNLTPEQAESAPNRNVLTRCVGIADSAVPDMFYGDTQRYAVYLLCSDGFRHKVTENEMIGQFSLGGITSEADLKRREEYLIGLNKHRGETDNISVITVAVY
jgi:serine/threonine protein phosphatase PrpC